MKKQNIEQIIKELFSHNYKLYPESYPESENGLVNEDADDNCEQWALDMWNNRDESEIERDEDLAITLADYKDWSKQTLYALQLEKY
jgi:hypothetical protein